MSATRPRATVRRVWQETPRLTGVVLEVDEAVAAAYTRPGQYVVLYPTPEQKLFLAIASAPGEARAVELLLGEAARQKLPLELGAEIELDPPAGKGFDLAAARGQDVILFGMGSGMSALRPLIAVIRQDRGGFGRVTLYAGAHTPDDLPYAAELEGWKRDRVDVVRAISRPYVQELFARDPVPVDRAVAFLVGSKPMMEETTAILGQAGLPADRVKKNF